MASKQHTRVLFPETGFGTRDAAAWYRNVAEWLLPHLRDTPVSFRRYPSTIDRESFWEKDLPGFAPPWVKTIDVPRRGGDSDIRYLVVNNRKTLLWLAEIGGIEIHPFLHRAPDLDLATALVFDLDPGKGADIADCCRVAILLRAALEKLSLQSFPKVSGSKGLQLFVPLNGDDTHDETEPFAKSVAEELAGQHPKRIVAKMAKELRTGRVFIDWSQNAPHKTNVAVYSLRAKQKQPFVSMPVTWDEVEAADRDALFFTPDAAVKRLRKRGDLFAPVLTLSQALPKIARGSTVSARSAKSTESREVIVDSVRLPKRRSQSGRRLFVLAKVRGADELWLEMRGVFKRWSLRADAAAAGTFSARAAANGMLDDAYYRGVVPAQSRGRVKIQDIGSYELIEVADDAMSLWFTGHVLRDRWLLEKNADGKKSEWTFRLE
jgi:bifunctional non-homologous end joining protein LigD